MDMKIMKMHSVSNGYAGILSYLYGDDDGFECFVLERAWMDNCHNVSAIPQGTYYCLFLEDGTPHFKYPVYELQDVHDRTAILIHGGNHIEDSEGCLMLGDRASVILGANGFYFEITNSRKTLEALCKYTQGDFYLNITR